MDFDFICPSGEERPLVQFLFPREKQDIFSKETIRGKLSEQLNVPGVGIEATLKEVEAPGTPNQRQSRVIGDGCGTTSATFMFEGNEPQKNKIPLVVPIIIALKVNKAFAVSIKGSFDIVAKESRASEHYEFAVAMDRAPFLSFSKGTGLPPNITSLVLRASLRPPKSSGCGCIII